MLIARVSYGQSVPSNAGLENHSEATKSWTAAIADSVVDLNAVVVRAKKLSVQNIMDSVIKYSARNYPHVDAFRSTLEIVLKSRSDDDTIFFRKVPLTLLSKKSKKYQYDFWVAPDEKTAWRVDSANANQRLRLVNFTGFPQKSLTELLRGHRLNASKKNAFYGSTQLDMERHFRIIFCHDALRMNALTRVVVGQRINNDTLMGFTLITVNPADWALSFCQTKFISVSREMADSFRKATRYTEVFALIEQATQAKAARYAASTILFERMAQGKYRLGSSIWEDNLMNFSHDPSKKAANPEGSVYSYRLTIDTPLFQKPKQALIPFNFRSTVDGN